MAKKKINTSFDISERREFRYRHIISLLPKTCNSILELGAGECILKNFLPKTIKYYPHDIVKRNSDFLESDLNKKKFPKINKQIDVICIAGVLEYLNDLEWLFNTCIQKSKYILFTYNCVQNEKVHPMVKKNRDANHWVNCYSRMKVENFFANSNSIIIASQLIKCKQIVIGSKKIYSHLEYVWLVKNNSLAKDI